MNYRYENLNPCGKTVGDCVIRAITKAMQPEGYDWYKTFTELMVQAYDDCDMPSSNAVWARFLMKHGFVYHNIMDKCLNCYTIKDFCDEHQDDKTYLVGTGEHLTAVISGVLYDIYNCGDLIPLYYFEKTDDTQKEVIKNDQSAVLLPTTSI